MIILRPRLHELVTGEENRTGVQLGALGVDTAILKEAERVVEISVGPASTPTRRLLALTLLDYVVRLDPLVTEVRLEGFEEADVAELAIRFPFECLDRDPGISSGFSVRVGPGESEADLVLDGAGWIASIGTALEESEPEGVLNPIGPLAAAGIGAGEIFKALLGAVDPGARVVQRSEAATGTFSFYDYSAEGASPALEELDFDAHLVGLGGVGAGVVRAVAALGADVHGRLRLVDADPIEAHNLNRLTYATLVAMRAQELKVLEAKAFLEAAAPNLDTTAHPEWFDAYRRSIAKRRAERRYDVIVTGVDRHHVRHEVQRELPRILIDASTGSDLNIMVERVVLGDWACVGCTKRAQVEDRPIDGDEECGNSPDPRAPSASFMSALAGTLAAGELFKEAMGAEGSLRGGFQHVFYAGPNEDQRVQLAPRPDCMVECSSEPVLSAYRRKYGVAVGAS